PLRPEEEPACAGARHAARVAFWVRDSERDALERHLLDVLREWLESEWAFDGVVFTVAQQETRQARLLEEADCEKKLAVVLSDGRPCVTYRYPARDRSLSGRSRRPSSRSWRL